MFSGTSKVASLVSRMNATVSILKTVYPVRKDTTKTWRIVFVRSALRDASSAVRGGFIRRSPVSHAPLITSTFKVIVCISQIVAR